MSIIIPLFGANEIVSKVPILFRNLTIAVLLTFDYRSCRGVWLFDNFAQYDARTGHVYNGVLEVQKSAELDTRNDYQGAEEIAEPEA